ncbi:DMT family transporter [Methylocucumis oryzae]|nr:DMT family transporter [Methylocucumis oryzae]
MNKQLTLGVAYMISAQFMFTIMAACVRGLRELPFIEIVGVRSVSGLLLFGTYMTWQGVSFRGRHRGDLLWRGCVGFMALIAHYYSITHVPLATATLLANTAPLLVAVLAAIFLHEALKFSVVLLILLSLFGVYLLVSPELHISRLGYAAGIAASVLIAGSFFFIRKLKHEHPCTVAFYFVAVSSIGSTPFAVQAWVWPSQQQWLLLLGVAISAFFAQLWLTRSFQLGKAAVISVMSYSGPVFAWLLGFFWFGEVLTGSALLGAGLVLASGVMFVLLERRPS